MDTPIAEGAAVMENNLIDESVGTHAVNTNKSGIYYDQEGSKPPINVIKSIDVSSRIGFIPNTAKKN